MWRNLVTLRRECISFLRLGSPSLAIMSAKTTAATTTTSVAIIGAGFGGLGMAIRLRQAGYEDVTVFEKGDDVGGVWRENAYPGAACDVPSHLYSYSFEPKADWSRRFARQPEILDYLKHCADKYDIRRQIRFGTEVSSATFDEDTAQWHLELADGTTHRAEVLVPACGQLSRPAYPNIPGLDSFEGHVFHSATWRPEVDLAGQDVAVIGTGASAIQIVPEIAPQAGRLRLFQREAAHVIRKPDYAYPSVAHDAFAAVPGLLRASRWATYWQLESRALAFTRAPQLMKAVEARFRVHLHHGVPDKQLRRRLVPQSQIGCKRILISNDYYPALSRPNVELVEDDITAVDPTGLVTANGEHHRADTIVLCTGFTATDLLAPMRIRGRNGIDLNDAWSDGAEAHLGLTVSGFPNLFLLYGPNTNLGHSSVVFMLESQIRYVLQAISRIGQPQVRWIEVRPDVQRASADEVQENIKRTVWDRGCTSWYRTPSGRNTLNWPGFTFDYWRRTRRISWDDFFIEPAPAATPARTSRRLSAPPSAMRTVMKSLQKTVFQEHVAWPAQRRRLHLAASTVSVTRARGVSVRADTVGTMPVVRVASRSRRSDAPTLVHLHGGGFCIGSPAQATAWAARLALATGGEVVLPRYPLSPEHPFPAASDALDQVWFALSETTPGPLLLGGDSAGANLALTLVQRLRDSQERQPDGLLLISPWLDLAFDREVDSELVDRDPMLTPDWLANCARAYAGTTPLRDPRLSPLNGDLAGLPPLLVQVGTDDVLAPDSHRVVSAVRQAGGEARLQIGENMWHDYVLHVGLLSAADLAADAAVEFIAETTSARTPSRS